MINVLKVCRGSKHYGENFIRGYIMKRFEDFEKMAMLELSEIERERVRERFDDVVAGFSVLDSYDFEGILTLVSVLDICNVMRDDVAGKVISRDDLLKNAPEQHDGYFQVPAVNI